MYRLARCGDCSQRAHHNALRQRCLTDHFPCARRSRTSEAISETDDAARRRPRGWSRCRLRRVPSIDTRSRCGGEEDRTPTGVVTQAVFKTVAVAIPRLAPPLGVLRSDRPEGRLPATSLDGDAHSYAASTVRLVHDQDRAVAPVAERVGFEPTEDEERPLLFSRQVQSAGLCDPSIRGARSPFPRHYPLRPGLPPRWTPACSGCLRACLPAAFP